MGVGTGKESAKRVRKVRVRGGNKKYRALRLDHGNFSWGSENHSFSSRIIDVVYNASNNELVRTKTLVKNCIVQIDATPFKQYYLTHYNIVLGKDLEDKAKLVSSKIRKKREKRAQNVSIDDGLKIQFRSGRLFACI